jgi:hypothetical protein
MDLTQAQAGELTGISKTDYGHWYLNLEEDNVGAVYPG